MDVTVRTADGRVATWEDCDLRVSVGKGIILMHSFVSVEMQRDEWDYYVTADLHFSLSEKRYLAKAVSIGVSPRVRLTNDDPSNPLAFRKNELHEITSVLLRQVKVAEITRLGASGAIFIKLDKDDPPASLLDWYGPEGEPRFGDGDIGPAIRRMGPVDSNLALLGLSYTIARISGDHPAKAVERQFGLPPRTASNWISKAKSLGHIVEPEIDLWDKFGLLRHKRPDKVESQAVLLDTIPAEQREAENWSWSHEAPFDAFLHFERVIFSEERAARGEHPEAP